MSNFYLTKFGRNADVDGAEDIWDFGSYYLFPTVAFETSIVGIANDIPSSDGVHSVEIHGLDINGAEITEVATLNGATPVVLANSYYRVNRAFIKKTGASLVNSGNISVSHTGSATLARISPSEGQTLQAIYTMPAGVNGSLVGWHINASRPALKTDVTASVRLQTRNAGEGWRTRDAAEIINGVDLVRQYQQNAKTVKGLTDIRLRVTAINTDNVAISGGFEIEGFRDIR